MNLVSDKEIIIEDSHVAINLMERDSHFLHIIGNLYNCNMIGRGNLIRITGEELQVEKVIQLIYELRYLLKEYSIESAANLCCSRCTATGENRSFP